jgi:hypothetical protein
MIIKVNPVKIKLEGYEDKLEELTGLLTFTNKNVSYEIERHKKSSWFLNKWGEEVWTEKLNELKAKQKVCLLEETSDGLFTYSGLADFLCKHFKDDFVDKVVYPEPDPIPWLRRYKFNLRPYQLEAFDQLLKNKHGVISHGTGTGKTSLMVNIVKALGLKTLIIVPSVSNS